MSYDIIKSISINPVKRTISVTSASNNVTPRIYGSWDPLKGGHFTFETWMDAFASDCFGGSAQFLPSCESKAHEAYLRACEQMGGDWSYAYRVLGTLDGPEYEQFKSEWCDIFINFCLNGKRDTRKFVMTRYGRPVSVSIRRGQYGGVSGHYRYTSNPRPVSWVKKTICEREFADFAAESV